MPLGSYHVEKVEGNKVTIVAEMCDLEDAEPSSTGKTIHRVKGPAQRIQDGLSVWVNIYQKPQTEAKPKRKAGKKK